MPKPLLPISGKPAINWWFDELKNKIGGKIYLVTNAHKWADCNYIPKYNILNNGDTSHEENQSFLSNVELVSRVKSLNDKTIIVQAELLFDPVRDVHFTNMLFDDDGSDKIIFCNNSISGEVHQKEFVLSKNLSDELSEKFRVWDVDDSSLMACVFGQNVLSLIDQYLLSMSKRSIVVGCKFGDDIEQFLKFVIHQNHCAKIISLSNIRLFKWKDPILDLSSYLSTFRYSLDQMLGQYLIHPTKRRSDPIITRSYARIGLMGNPSDGFYGKTISLLISNFFAEITLIPNKILDAQEYSRIAFLPSLTFTATSFSSIQSLASIFSLERYSNADILLHATCKVFYTHCRGQNISLHNQGFKILLETNIPRQVGLAGSSAIITAFWKGMMRFYCIDDAKIALSLQAKLILDVEKVELGINAGLQDRVIQTYGGLMYMDFEKEMMLKNNGIGKYERIDENLLPKGLWIAYDINPSDSGKIHSDVRKRYESGNQKVIHAMEKFASLAERARQLLLDSSHNSFLKRKQLASLMTENFNLRKEIYDKAIDAKSLRMIELANMHGFAAKFTGSGGAIVGLWNGDGDDGNVVTKDSDGSHFKHWSEKDEAYNGKREMMQIELLKRDLQKEGFVFCEVKLLNEKFDEDN
ncbi:8271_t:CDS:2 [Acaulospora morrowiae]|uniref:8271_t:CDS:1 n=1 Tax=Acaulospora morrowiae TaxID=94023 RepID=A0A9N8ZNN0_9GLOM|nr:8271_t:CDS:2 [Acaulospora morrowiae]